MDRDNDLSGTERGQQLCFMREKSEFLKGLHADEEFPHDRSKRALEWLSSPSQSLTVGFDDGVELGRAQCSHVETATDLCPSALDTATTGAVTSIVVKGSQARQRTQLIAIELRDFR